MPAYASRALVLRKTKLGEADLILTLLAEDGRQIRAVAKSARKGTSKLGGRLEPYAVADLLLHTGRTLDIIAEAETVASHHVLREDYDACTAAAVVADVLDKVSCEGQADDRLFGLGTATLDAMEAATPGDLPALVVAFLVKSMAMSGYRPQLASCVACAGESGTGGLFSLEAGGVLCAACGATEPAALPISADAHGVLSAVLQARMSEVSELEAPSDGVLECLRLMRSFVAYHVPARLKALELYAAEAGGDAYGR